MSFSRVAGDALTREGAERLARQIQAYWAALGYRVETRVEPALCNDVPSYVIRSDMVGGRPRQ